MSKQDAQRWCYKWSPNGKKLNAWIPFPVTGNWFRPAAWHPNCQRFGPARLQLPVRCSFGCIKASTAAPPLHCYAMCNRLSQWVSDLPACLCRCLCRCLCLCPTEPVSDRDWCPLSVNGHNWWLKTWPPLVTGRNLKLGRLKLKVSVTTFLIDLQLQHGNHNQ